MESVADTKNGVGRLMCRTEINKGLYRAEGTRKTKTPARIRACRRSESRVVNRRTNYSYLWPAVVWQATQSVLGCSAKALCIGATMGLAGLTFMLPTSWQPRQVM